MLIFALLAQIKRNHITSKVVELEMIVKPCGLAIFKASLMIVVLALLYILDT
jgi:hypothetical protein